VVEPGSAHGARHRRHARHTLAAQDDPLWTVPGDRRHGVPSVIAACAEPRPDQDGTWITSEVFDAYCTLASLGVAHSIEAWDGDTLAGGLYGVAIGRVFFGESMFARRSDASKVALAHLVRQLRRWGFPLIDCQMSTSHLASLGAQTISRAEFLATVRRYVTMPAVPAPWRLDDDLLGTMD
jgi:leucyl/phenylalanyl-tRNA--protein transferase